MRKNKLIELLQAVQGNPEIVLWNGHVGDWMAVSDKLIESDLVKQTFNSYIYTIELQEQRDRNDWEYKLTQEEIEKLKKAYSKDCVWQIGQYVTEEDVKSGSYQKKRVVFISAKPRGLKMEDRSGTIEY